jgi:hypothetical protein
VEGVSSALLPRHARILQEVLDDQDGEILKPKSDWCRRLKEEASRHSTSNGEEKVEALQGPADLLSFIQRSVQLLRHVPLERNLLQPTQPGQPGRTYPCFYGSFFHHRNVYDLVDAALKESLKYSTVTEEGRLLLLLLPKIPTFLKKSGLMRLFELMPETSADTVEVIQASFARTDLHVLKEALPELITKYPLGAKHIWCQRLRCFVVGEKQGQEKAEKKSTSKKRVRKVQTEVGPTPKSVRLEEEEEEEVEETDEGDTSEDHVTEDGDTTDTDEINVGPDP